MKRGDERGGGPELSYKQKVETVTLLRRGPPMDISENDDG